MRNILVYHGDTHTVHRGCAHHINQNGTLSIFKIELKDIMGADGAIIYDYEVQGDLIAVYNKVAWNRIVDLGDRK